MAKIDTLERQAEFFDNILVPALDHFARGNPWEECIGWDITKPGMITLDSLCFEDLCGEYGPAIGSLDIVLEVIANEHALEFTIGHNDEGDEVFTFLFK